MIALERIKNKQPGAMFLLGNRTTIQCATHGALASRYYLPDDTGWCTAVESR